jgi:hypothetical protein
VPCQRKIVDTPDGLPGLITKLIPQLNALRVVAMDCFDAREAEILSSNFFPEIRKDLLRIDRAKFTGTIRSQAIFRFLEPHRITRGVGLV